MLKVIGFHEHFRSNGMTDQTDDFDRKAATYNFSIDVNSILSFSVYSNHVVWVTKDGQGYAVGDNRGYAIIGTLQEKEYTDTTKFDFIDDQGQACKLLSVVCGSCYTLYHVQPHNPSDNTRLAFVEWQKGKGKPLFLNTTGWNAKRLFGGRETAAAIDTSGSIIIISDVVFDSPDESPPILFLPDKEKASCVAASRNFIFALSLSGKVSSCRLSPGGKIESEFNYVEELKDIKCIQISAMWDHCFVVTEDGRVFAFGTNVSGQIGLPGRIRSVNSFTYVDTLSKYKIKSAFAGYMHSLFITYDGMVLACGRNMFGQLFLESGPSNDVIYTPVETSIKSGATFAIAGPGISAVWIETQPPPNMPNMPLTAEDYASDNNEMKSQSVFEEGSENSKLKEELMKIKKEKEDLIIEIEKLKNELKEAHENEENLKKKVLLLEEKIGK